MCVVVGGSFENAKNRIDYVCVMKHNGKSTVCFTEPRKRASERESEKKSLSLCGFYFLFCLPRNTLRTATSAIIWIDKCYTSTINKSWLGLGSMHVPFSLWAIVLFARPRRMLN